MGVKSLWHLLTPVGRPVMLETIEGKALAIDSSIWIYQFQATMRDKDGRALINAHVLGFLRRICKLLFYGIKPVFVFDGGAPALKRATINERKKKRSGAAAGHAQIAERLLAAHMRREALNHTSTLQSSKATKGKGKAPAGSVSIDDSIVYLEDVNNSAPKTPVKKTKSKSKDSPASKKNRFHDHDPYRLPDVDLSEAIAKATRSAPDPRLATDEELRNFIEEMKPEDFDVTSPTFRELPTEVQYEIIGDLRLKSRQTSYRRLQNMLDNAPTPLDFSKQQIKNLKQRNALTQQLLITTDSIGKANISIPVRIASERNKEYILVKNEGEGGGWILGVRDDGTQAKPIEIDQDSDERESPSEDESDEDMEEVNVLETSAPDEDLREYRQEMALSGIAARQTPKRQRRANTSLQPKLKATPLFDLSDDDEDFLPRPETEIVGSDYDEDLAMGIQASMDDFGKRPRSTSMKASSLLPSDSISTNNKTFEISTPLKTALSFANAGSSRRRLPSASESPPSSSNWLNAPAHQDIQPIDQQPPQRPASLERFTPIQLSTVLDEDSDQDMEEVVPFSHSISPIREQASPGILLENGVTSPNAVKSRPEIALSLLTQDDQQQDMLASPDVQSDPSIVLPLFDEHDPDTSTPPEIQDGLSGVSQPSSNKVLFRPSDDHHENTSTSLGIPVTTGANMLHPPSQPESPISINSESRRQENIVPAIISDAEPESRSSSPLPDLFITSRPPSPEVESWDAAHEMDVAAEEGEFARFVSHVKGKDIQDVRREIDEEIRSLNQQKKLAMRDSEEITQQMIAQIMTMLRLFGIPYITAPMEAEAQCAALVSLGLVEGIITDDSDVFLFGGERVFKNMFNQSKTVECFFLRDLERELGLDRNTLIRLAYLLGSDYVEGLPGVGPVVAMEILREFPGEDGLHKFKEWWMRVQTGRDSVEESKSQFRKRFKKKFRDLYLEKDWPNAAVRDAYLHPTVDDSDEPFKWGLPDLDALRDFFGAELGWPQNKVDELLLPIIQRMRKRQQAAALNKQGNLNEFFDVTAGSGTFAPRKRQAYASKRLQQVVSEFRNKQAKLKSGSSNHELDDAGSVSENEGPVRKKVKNAKGGRKGPGKSTTGAKVTTASRKQKVSKTGGKNGTPEVVSSSEEEYKGETAAGEEPLRIQLRPRPKPAYRQSS